VSGARPSRRRHTADLAAEAEQALTKLRNTIALVHHLAAAGPIKGADVAPIETALADAHGRLERLLRRQPALAADPDREAFWRLLRTVAAETLAACDAIDPRREH